ncbi:P-loop ATPase, Sll1717 family [Streptomyces stelliscabiei]|uniref:P-loop ATPase, Sll1717 family n=1 Tax=Streptomyces stelliscabiei TaxID=146820 RepID=UPI0029A7F1E8|nr:ATP-binding protein [Streptomyces stelliscabiei]MDX2554736.1 ATP-binding protein [Streptomyces stelliscabiei]MDX2613263.1 ATP-binding protein [Streptomyces stelliscabiei]MDX2638461.1 ATP-binding protein [Streptomyces stelliscabiei]MDX2661613.1 ATP-binding protein [Streptomyces stelliscabiei]MDX2712254.1 ATP-binding protein [Streptomyces stelliscabiei]
MDRSPNYFGEEDAAYTSDAELTAQHVFRDIERSLKWDRSTKGIQVVVGVKGSGKTELRRHLESSKGYYIFNLDANNAYFSQDISTIDQESGRTKNAIAAILLREFARRIGESHRSNAANLLKTALDASTNALKKVPNAVDLTVPGATLRLGELLKQEASSVLQSSLDKLVADVAAALRSAHKRGAILIDDVESVFDGIWKNPLLLEGLARAVRDINERGSDRIHAVLFVKHGLWRSWYEKQEEYDKVRGVIEFLTWDHDALVKLIAKRIAHRHGIHLGDNESIDVEGLWAKEFSWSGSFDDLTRYCTRYCVSGPRDMVALCNLAAKSAYNELITVRHVEASLGAYSQDKIHNLNADFGKTYPDIRKFVEQVFQSAPKKMTGRELAQLVQSRTLTVPRVHNDLKKWPWYANATKERLATITYQIGVVGYESSHGMTYAIEQPDLSPSDLLAQQVVCVHPAFRPHLAIV